MNKMISTDTGESQINSMTGQGLKPTRSKLPSRNVNVDSNNDLFHKQQTQADCAQGSEQGRACMVERWMSFVVDQH